MVLVYAADTLYFSFGIFKYYRQTAKIELPFCEGVFQNRAIRVFLESNCLGVFSKKTTKGLAYNANPLFITGAGGRNRTDTELPPRDFESRASTNFTTPAKCFGIITKATFAVKEENQIVNLQIGDIIGKKYY